MFATAEQLQALDTLLEEICVAMSIDRSSKDVVVEDQTGSLSPLDNN